MSFDEKKYFILYKKNPEAGFTYLYECFHKPIIGFCLHNHIGVDNAKEITQEVFCKIWDQIHNLDPTKSIQSYLFATAKNIILDNYRRIVKTKAAKEYSFYFLTHENETENQVLFNELNREIQNTLDEMPEMQKLVFQMSRFKGYSNKEISKELGIAIKTVEGHMSKALKTFKNKLKDTSALIILAKMTFEFIL